MSPENQRTRPDSLDLARKTDRNAILIAIIFAMQTIMVAYLENRVEDKVEQCRARIESVNGFDLNR